MFKNFYRGKKVLVTGHTGFKGSWLTQWLLDLGAEVAGFSDCVPTEPAHFEALGLRDKIRHYEGDVGNLEQVRTALHEFKPEIVLHLAAQAIVYESYHDPQATFLTNVLGTVNVLESIRDLPGVQVAVCITSDKCYENVEWDFGYRETDRLGGKDPYSGSKACAEIAFSSYARSFFAEDSGPRLATARAGNVIGGGDWAAYRVVPDCVRAWSQNEKVDIRNPASTRPWQHVLEPLSGYLCLAQRLADQPELHGQSFNLGPNPGSNHSVAELLEQLQKSWPEGQWQTPEGIKSLPEAGLLQLCCDKANRHLDWRATLDFEQTAALTGDWYYRYYQEGVSAEMLTAEHIARYTRLASEQDLAWTSA